LDVGLEELDKEEKYLQELKKRYLDEISSIDVDKRKLLDEIQIMTEKIHSYQSLEKTLKSLKHKLYVSIDKLKQKLNSSIGEYYSLNSLLTFLQKEEINNENLLEIEESIVNKLKNKVKQLKEVKKIIENAFSYDYFKGDYVLKYEKLLAAIEYLEELDPDKALDLKNLLKELEIVKDHLKNLSEEKSRLEKIRTKSKQAIENLKNKLEELKSILLKLRKYIELNNRYAILFEQTLPVFEKKSNKWKEKIFTNIEKERINLSEKLKELRNKIKKIRNKNLENLNRVLNKYFLQAYNALNVGGLRIQVNEISTDKWFYSFEVLNKQGLTLQGLNQSVKDIANIVLLLSLMETFPEMSQYFILSIIDEALERTDEENTKVFLNKIIPMLSSKVQTLIAILDKNYQYINKNNFRNLHVIIYKMQGIENGLPKYEKEVIL
jgi:DNA repair ATPase RecN